LSYNDIKSQTESKMSKGIDSFKSTISKVRTGRASTSLLEHLLVDYYGNPTLISQVASLTLVDARTISVTPWEKTMLVPVEKAIRESNLGLNPLNKGTVILVPLPALSEERRNEMIKIVKSNGEDAKIAIRNHRRDANEQLKKLSKAKEITEDQEKQGQAHVQKLTDRFIVEIDHLVNTKEKELLKI
jgi:ribosome recycling factor